MGTLHHLADYRPALSLVHVDALLAEVELLESLAYQKLDHLPERSLAWTWALEHWVDLVAERQRLRVMRGEVLERMAGNG